MIGDLDIERFSQVAVVGSWVVRELYGPGEQGLEIAEGELRLVRWPDRARRPRRVILRRADLAETLQRCAQ